MKNKLKTVKKKIVQLKKKLISHSASQIYMIREHFMPLCEILFPAALIKTTI